MDSPYKSREISDECYYLLEIYQKIQQKGLGPEVDENS